MSARNLKNDRVGSGCISLITRTYSATKSWTTRFVFSNCSHGLGLVFCGLYVLFGGDDLPSGLCVTLCEFSEHTPESLVFRPDTTSSLYLDPVPSLVDHFCAHRTCSSVLVINPVFDVDGSGLGIIDARFEVAQFPSALGSFRMRGCS